MGHMPVLQGHVKRHTNATYAPGVRCSQVIPNLLSCTNFRLKCGNGCSTLSQGCKTPGWHQWSKWKRAPEIHSTKDVAMNVSVYTSNHFRVKVYLLCWKSSKPHGMFTTFQNHPKPQAQEPREELKSSTVFSRLLLQSALHTDRPISLSEMKAKESWT